MEEVHNDALVYFQVPLPGLGCLLLVAILIMELQVYFLLPDLRSVDVLVDHIKQVRQ
jgi:hypothetical protein